MFHSRFWPGFIACAVMLAQPQYAQQEGQTGDIISVAYLKDPVDGYIKARRDVPRIRLQPEFLYEVTLDFKSHARNAASSQLHPVSILVRIGSASCKKNLCWYELATLDRSSQSTVIQPHSEDVLIVLKYESASRTDFKDQSNNAICTTPITRLSTPEANGWAVCMNSTSGAQTVTITKVSNQ